MSVKYLLNPFSAPEAERGMPKESEAAARQRGQHFLRCHLSLAFLYALPLLRHTHLQAHHCSLANRVVHYEPVRHSLDPRNTDARGRADGNEGDRRRPPKVQGRSSQKRSRPTTRLASSLLNRPRSPTRRRRPPPPPLRATTTLKARSRSTSPAQSTSTRPRRELNTAQKSSSPTGESSGRSSRVSCPQS